MFQTLHIQTGTDGSHASFDTSIECCETASFLSGNEALDDILSEPGGTSSYGGGTTSSSVIAAPVTLSSASGSVSISGRQGSSLSAPATPSCSASMALAAVALPEVSVFLEKWPS